MALGGNAADSRWRITLLLTCVQAMSFYHRTLVTLFAEPIKSEYAVSDTQIGVLIGTAFSLSYVVFSLPLGHAADRSDRFKLLGICIAGWSVLTSMSAAATTFASLVVCRIGAAAAMAGATPCSGAVLADLFHRSEIAKPMGLYSSGLHLGVGLAMVTGAAMAVVIDPFGSFRLGPVGLLSGWKVIFLIAGVPGLALAALVASKAGTLPLREAAAGDRSPLAALQHIIAHPRAYCALVLGLALLIFGSNATGAWLPSLFHRKFGWSVDEIGLWYGIIVVTAGFAGAAGSGFLVERVGSIGGRDPQLLALIGAAIVILPVSVALPLVSSPYASLALFLVRSLLGGMTIGIGYSLVIGQAPTAHRATLTAAASMAFHVIGGGMGPIAVALSTDFIFADPAALPYSMALVAGSAALLALAALAATTVAPERA